MSNVYKINIFEILKTAFFLTNFNFHIRNFGIFLMTWPKDLIIISIKLHTKFVNH